MKTKKSIFAFDDFREYLKDVYDSAKTSDRKFSFRYFARIFGSKNPSFLKLVIEGERNLTSRHVENWIRHFKLKEEEAFFFRNLVHFNQSRTIEEKHRYLVRIQQSKSYRKAHPLTFSQYAYFTNWYFVPIREMVSLRDFREDPKWIARQLKFPVTETQIETAISEMLKLGILRRNAEGRLEQTNAFVTTDDRIVSAALAKSHQDLIKKGAESIDRIPREEREIFGFTFSIPQDYVEKVKAKVQDFRRELMDLIATSPEPDSVYQFHFMLFPLAQTKKRGEHD